VKRFYSIKLKYYKENVPSYIAKMLLVKESPLINYLKKNRALKWVYRKNKNVLDCYANEKHLMIGKIKYPEMFGLKGKMGFMELYISHILERQINIARGST
jgi:hypothetical protein